MLNLLATLALLASVAKAQVIATGPNGDTNPAAPILGTPINQTSYSRLATIDSWDDFCIYGPPEPNSVIGDVEAIAVAWCTKARNNARVIPDGTFTAVHFVKTPLYVQVFGFGDFTKINIANGDDGGELDPHGEAGLGNPVGANVTSNVSGADVFYAEWMNFMSYNQFCIRACTAANATYTAARMCDHIYDKMGCKWVMPGDYADNSFTECLGDAAYPPGDYPQPNGSTSTFAQRYTGVYTNGDGSVGTFTIGETSTPATAYSTPATSQCTTHSSIANGIPLSSLGISSTTASASGSSAGPSGSGASSRTSGASTSRASGSSSGTAGGAAMGYTGPNYGPAIASVFSVFAVIVGAGAFIL